MSVEYITCSWGDRLQISVVSRSIDLMRSTSTSTIFDTSYPIKEG